MAPKRAGEHSIAAAWLTPESIGIAMNATKKSAESPDLAAAIPNGRKVLLVVEVAKLLAVTEQHILNLIDEGKLAAIDVGCRGRHFWRIPVTAYERYLRENSESNI
jgi:excisionase family DNA binding protein